MDKFLCLMLIVDARGAHATALTLLTSTPMSADGEACGDHCSCGETAPLPSGVRYDAFADTPKNGGWGRLAFADGYHVYHAHTSFIASGGGRCLRYVPIFKSGNDAIRFNLRAMTLRAAAAERDAAGAEPGTAGDGNRSAIRWGEVSNREEGPYLKRFCHRGVVHFTFVREPASHLLSALREHMWQQCFVQSRTTPLRPSGVAWANRHCARTPYGRALAQNLAYFVSRIAGDVGFDAADRAGNRLHGLQHVAAQSGVFVLERPPARRLWVGRLERFGADWRAAMRRSALPWLVAAEFNRTLGTHPSSGDTLRVGPHGQSGRLGEAIAGHRGLV